ncbi:MAG: class I SAM-dependent methyltransferase [bacterium]|nr:class I SAM-dependent methyltransferase [bacterium]
MPRGKLASRAATDVHDDRIRQAFTQQAPVLSVAPTFHAEDILRAIRDGLAGDGKGRLLDAGCGPGVVLAAVGADFAEVCGLDLTPAMVERAKIACQEADLTGAEIQVGSMLAMPFDDGQFDAVVTRLTLHHLEAPGDALREMARVLRPGGTLVIADLLGCEDPAEAALQDALEILRDPSHVRLLPESEMRALVAQAGLNEQGCERLDKRRGFAEWASIVNAPERTEPLLLAMRTLAESGCGQGIELAMEADQPTFVHRWAIWTLGKAGGKA